VVPPPLRLLPFLLLPHQPPPVESQDSPDSDMLPDKWEETKAHLHPSEPQHLLLPQLLPFPPLLLHHQPLPPQSFLDSDMPPERKWATSKDSDSKKLLELLVEDQLEPEHLPPPLTT
jgi:hypothetical protein